MLHSPAAERNKGAVAAVLKTALPADGVVLEVASGSGQHVAHWAREFPALRWQPSDADAEARASIQAWVEDAGVGNVAAPVALDAAADLWPVTRADAVVCLNLVHISAWRVTVGLLAGAARVLPPGAPLVLYGPYLRLGVATAPSNVAFDASLRERNPAWGLRSLEVVLAEAGRHGLAGAVVVELPANNLAVVLRRA